MRIAFGLVSLLALVAAFLLSTQMRWSLLLLVVAALGLAVAIGKGD